MELKISGKNMKLTKVLKEYVDEKISKMDKYLNNFDPVYIDVELHTSGEGKGQPRSTVEVTIRIPNAILRCEETAPDMYEAIDIAEEKVEKKLRRLKEKIEDKDKKLDFDISTLGHVDTKDLKKMIKKRKNFELGRPMTEEEAIGRMELLGHDFYIFVDKKTKIQSTVYRREDGGYGVIYGK